jgi:hypothetical protein
MIASLGDASRKMLELSQDLRRTADFKSSATIEALHQQRRSGKASGEGLGTMKQKRERWIPLPFV